MRFGLFTASIFSLMGCYASGGIHPDSGNANATADSGFVVDAINVADSRDGGHVVPPPDACPLGHASCGAVDSGREVDTGVDGDGDCREPGCGRDLCAPMDARIEVCRTLGDFRSERAFFDGTRCVVHRGNCIGADCDAFMSLDECRAATAGCASSLCRESGGRWDESGCGHSRCGASPMCDAVVPGCQCGIGRTFRDGVGCAPDPSCSTPSHLCTGSGGRWVEPGGGCLDSCICGRPCDSLCRPVLSAFCSCGQFRQFDPMRGCVERTDCTDEERGMLCTSTGGTWGNTCENTSCGEHSPLPCAALACSCPAGFAYRDGEGCVEGGCWDQCARTCASPNICCPSGGARIGPDRCIAPICTTGRAACPPPPP